MAKDCTPKCGENNPPISSASVIYKGQLLTCIGADIPDTIESIVKKLDTAICQKLSDINALNRFLNTGNGIELYTGQNVFGQNELATLSSPDGSVNISYDETTKEVNIEVDFPAIQQTVLTSIDGSIDITDNGDNNFDLSVVFPEEEFLTLEAGDNVTIVDGSTPNSKRISATTTASYITLTSPDSSVNINQSPDGSSAQLTVDFPEIPVVPEQVQSNVLETNINSKAYIQNQNANRVITSNIVLNASDNNKVIVANSQNDSLTITIPSPLPAQNNYFVGIIQRGINEVTVNGATVIQEGYQNKIEGDGHHAAIEIISVSGVPQAFLLGSLKQTI